MCKIKTDKMVFPPLISNIYIFFWGYWHFGKMSKNCRYDIADRKFSDDALEDMVRNEYIIA